MGEKQFAKEPLLYIHQPTIHKPSAPMQHHYRTPKQSKTIKKNASKEKIYVDATGEKQSKDHKSVKFNDMTLLEKVNYLVDQPEPIPEIKCLLRTNEKTYRGIITGFNNSNVTFREERYRGEVTIPFKQITTIKMIGF